MLLRNCQDKVLVQLEDRTTQQSIRLAIDNYGNRLNAVANIDGVMSTFAGPTAVQGGFCSLKLDRTPDSRLVLNVGGVHITSICHPLISTAQLTRVQGATVSGALRWITPRNNRVKTRLVQTSTNSVRIELRTVPVTDLIVEFGGGAQITFGPHQASFDIPRGLRSALNFRAPAYQEHVPRAAVPYSSMLIPESQAFMPRILTYPARDLTRHIDITVRPECSSVYINDSVFDLESRAAESALGTITLMLRDPMQIAQLVMYEL